MVDWVCKIGKDIQRILKWLFVLLMTAQIVLGIGWLIANIDYLPLYQETSLMIKAAETMVIDEYMGMLYPLLIMTTKWVSKVVPVPYYTLIYVLQLCMAGFAVVYMLRYSRWIKGSGCSKKIKMAFVTGYGLTFPLLLQLHMAVLPYSFAMSVAIILICDGLYYLRNMDKVNGSVLIRLCGLWLLDVLFLPEYSWLLGIFVGGVLIRILTKNKVWRVRILISILATVLCFGVTGTTTQTPGSMGRVQKTVGASMMSRFVWPYFVAYSNFWDERVSDTFDFESLSGIAMYQEEVVYTFGPILDEKYGREAANQIYWDMALTSFKLDTKRILQEIGRDFTSYLCPIVLQQIHMVNNAGSLTAWNYGRLQDESPVLTKYYISISFAGWNVMCILGLLMMLLQKRSGKLLYSHVLLCVSALFMALWYTMQGAGIQDYKKVMLISFIWLFPVIKGFLLTEENMERDEDIGNE